MDNELSRRVALGLIEARSVEDVQKTLSDAAAREWFDAPKHWTPYGNRDKNWDTVGNQMSNPIGALVEIVTNGIDAILLRKARESGISDMRGAHAPQSMFEAVKRFFPGVVEGRIARLAPGERGDLARKCIRVAVTRGHRKNHKYPTYTFVDSGDGQAPDDFPKTFLSLSEKNKDGIPFVQGKYNMGSTGTLRFCTRSDIRLGHYKLIVSRRPGEQYWGWTLIRVREPRKGETLPVAEYFQPYGHVIPRFSADTIFAFSHHSLGVIGDGSIIKLFEYDIGTQARSVDFGLYNALTVNLIDSALPVQLYDFDAKPVEGKGPLRREGIAERTFGGLNSVLRADMAEPTTEAEEGGSPQSSNTEWVYLVEDIKDADLGHIQIVATGVSKLKDFLSEQPARAFYTINGQTHAFERASFLNTRVGLPDLRNHLLINVVCDEMNKTALATIFMPDRERKTNTELARKLEQRVIDALKGDDKLRAYAAEVRRRRASEYIEDDGETATLLQELIKTDPAIRDLFGIGTFLPDLGKTPGGQEPFKGKKFPTFLKPLNLRLENNMLVKEVPLNGIRRIECGTDAADDYLTRLDSPGEVWCSLDEQAMPHSAKLRSGTARFTVQVPKSAQVGQEVTVKFGFKDYGRNLEPLKFEVLIRYTEAEESHNRPSGPNSQTKPNQQNIVGEPKFEWVREEQWSEHGFDENVEGIVGGLGSVLTSFKRSLARSGYEFEAKVVNAANFGVPQNRKRTIGIAVDRLRHDFEFDVLEANPRLKRYVTVAETIGHLPPLAAGEKHHKMPNHRARGLNELNLKRISCAPPGGSNAYLKETPWGDLSLVCHQRLEEREGAPSFSDTYTRMRGDDVAPTITTKCMSISNGRFGHYDINQNRAITPREAALLQTFPERYVFYPEENIEFTSTLIGNAVPPRLAKFFGEYIIGKLPE